MSMKSLGAKTIVYPTPTWVVGAYDASGKPNVMTAAWGGICCSKPPCLAVSLRAATYTHGSIMARKAFTVSVPSEHYLAEADFFGMASGRDVDKFAVTGLTPERSALVDAPYVAEFPLVVECTVLHVHELGLHTQFVGEIQDVKVREDICDADGRPDITRARPFVFDPASRNYVGLGGILEKGFSAGQKLLAK